MQEVLDACLFKQEGCSGHSTTPTRVDLDVLGRYVDRGRARLIPIEHHLASVAVREGSQGDVAGLPCGARSLVIDRETGAIHVRGVNKFFDFEDVSDAWLADPSVWSARAAYAVYAQRKMAGFVVTLFSNNGVALQCMSKHVLGGPHVEMATDILARRLTERQRLTIACDLHARDVTASCECIHRAHDIHHPVLEDARFDETLVLFAVQQRRCLQERALPFAEVERTAAILGLPCTPGHQLTSAADVEAALAATHTWDAAYAPLSPPPTLAEGLVLLLEVACEGDTAWVRPVRLKAKTTAYVAARSLRSLLRGDSQPRLLLFHRAVLSWAAAKGVSVADLRRTESMKGISSVVSAFMMSISERVRAQPCRRFRAASFTAAEAYDSLLTITSRQVFGRAVPHHSLSMTSTPTIAVAGGRRAPITLMLFCGLPGSGKSTLCARLVEALVAAESSCPFGYVVIISRDAVTRAMSAQLGITAESSKHKRRRLGYPVHKEILRRFDLVRQFALGADTPVLLLFDACNATPATRRVWRTALPQPLVTSHTVLVECVDNGQLAERVASRRMHELLSDPAEAQRALYTVRSKFIAPTPEENATFCDTAVEPPDVVAERLAALACTPFPTTDCSHIVEPLSIEQLEAELWKRDDEVLHSLLGMEHWSTREATVMASLLSAAASSKRGEGSIIALRVDTPFDELRGRVAAALARLLQPAEPTTLAGKLIATVRGALFGTTQGAAADPVLVAGHTAWLRGWLFRGKTANYTREALMCALAERFERCPPQPHVTLLYSPDGTAGVEEFWTDSGLKAGQRVFVAAEEVLLDRFGLCFGVVLSSPHRTHQWLRGVAVRASERTTVVSNAEHGDADEPHAGPRLHLTLGTAHGVRSGYCGDMFALFPTWQARNTTLKEKKAQHTANRSQDKFVNFVHLRLPQTILLTGVVEELWSLGK